MQRPGHAGPLLWWVAGPGELLTVANGRHLALCLVDLPVEAGEGRHQGDDLVRSLSLVARMAVRLNDSCARRGAVNDRRQ